LRSFPKSVVTFHSNLKESKEIVVNLNNRFSTNLFFKVGNLDRLSQLSRKTGSNRRK
jgi:hypothetical protein